jgi:hypothetical protein
MGSEPVLAHSGGAHTCHMHLTERRANAADMTQYLVQQTDPSQEGHFPVFGLFGVSWKGNTMNIRHLLQLPLKPTFSATHVL